MNEEIKTININELVNFKNHPFKVVDDNLDMEELLSSIKKNGVIEPIVVRPIKNNKYEIISGHRRKRACEILGINEIRCIVSNLSNDEAIIKMVDSNLKRDKILPSEKAYAYKMRLEAMKHQGKKRNITFAPLVPKLKEARDILADEVGESREQIRRYIRLTELIPQILQLVDEDKIGLRPAVEISYLTIEEQNILYLCIKERESTPTHDQAIRMKNLSQKELLDNKSIEKIMDELKPNQKEYIKLDSQKFRNLIPNNIMPDKREDYIYNAIDFYNKFIQKKKNNQR